MRFLELHERLRLETRRRIDRRVLSTSLLARQTGLAPTHISNFLNRRRRLSLPALDRILMAEELSVEELSTNSGAAPAAATALFRESGEKVPIVSQLAAMTAPVIVSRAILDFVHLPQGWLAGLPLRRAFSRKSWERFLAVRVTAAQAMSMDPVLRVGAVVVLDRHYNSLSPLKLPHPNLYGVRSGTQLLFRHVIFESSRLVLRPRTLELPLEVIELAPHESPSDLIVGRVCLCISQL